MITGGRIALSAYSRRINRGFQARQPDVLRFAVPAAGAGVAPGQIIWGWPGTHWSAGRPRFW